MVRAKLRPEASRPGPELPGRQAPLWCCGNLSYVIWASPDSSGNSHSDHSIGGQWHASTIAWNISRKDRPPSHCPHPVQCHHQARRERQRCLGESRLSKELTCIWCSIWSWSFYNCSPRTTTCLWYIVESSGTICTSSCSNCADCVSKMPALGFGTILTHYCVPGMIHTDNLAGQMLFLFFSKYTCSFSPVLSLTQAPTSYQNRKRIINHWSSLLCQAPRPCPQTHCTTALQQDMPQTFAHLQKN